MAKKATYEDYVVTIEDNNSVNVTKDGKLCGNTKDALREIAENIGLQYDSDWNTRQCGAKVYKAITELSSTVPNSKEKAASKNKNIKEASNSKELSAAQAEIARLKAELAEAKAAQTKKEDKPTKKSKSNDPFEGLMVRVCAGMYKQKFYSQRHEYRPGYYRQPYDKRKKAVWISTLNKWDAPILFSRETTITKPFNICKYPVTQGQWKKIMGEGFNPSHFKGDDNLPVESVTREEMLQFIDKLNKLTGKRYRLPTEAEWQWAAIGAAKDKDQGDWAGCSKIEELEQYAWFKNNSDGKTHPVGQKKPNELGLYDMSGNVEECCADTVFGDDKSEDYWVHWLGGVRCVDGDVYHSETNGSCVIRHTRTGYDPVTKGGSFNELAESSISSCTCLVYGHGHIQLGERSMQIGFRLAETIEE